MNQQRAAYLEMVAGLSPEETAAFKAQEEERQASDALRKAYLEMVSNLPPHERNAHEKAWLTWLAILLEKREAAAKTLCDSSSQTE